MNNTLKIRTRQKMSTEITNNAGIAQTADQPQAGTTGTTHTPLPWSLHVMDSHRTPTHMVTAQGEYSFNIRTIGSGDIVIATVKTEDRVSCGGGYPAPPNSALLPNVELILRAVNNHSSLIAALRVAQSALRNIAANRRAFEAGEFGPEKLIHSDLIQDSAEYTRAAGQTVTAPAPTAQISAAEWGYRACERGLNLQAALAEFDALFRNPTP